MVFKLLHLILSLNLLVSSTGITVYEHKCSKNGSTFALFQKPKSCCSKKKSGACSISGCSKHKQTQGIEISSKPCCEDKSHYDKLSITAISKEPSAYSDINPDFSNNISWTYIGCNEFNPVNERVLRLNLYKPPPLLKDNLRVLHMSFLC